MRDWIIKIRNNDEIRIDKMKAESQFKAEQYWKERGDKAQAIPYDKGNLKAVCEAAKKDYRKVVLSPQVSMEIA